MAAPMEVDGAPEEGAEDGDVDYFGEEGDDVDLFGDDDDGGEEPPEDGEEGEDPREMNEIVQEDAFAVINSFFAEKGLCFQQIGSFDDFVTFRLQEMVDEHPAIEVEPREQYNPDSPEEKICYSWKFGQVSMHKPLVEEQSGKRKPLYPNQARQRNLVYASELYCDVDETTYKLLPPDEKNPDGSREVVRKKHYEKIRLGRLPMMLKSEYCWLKGLNQKQLVDLGECVYDQGGYFIINGSEKVLVALERMADNFVYAFQKKQPSKYTWVCEVRSRPEGSQAVSGFQVKMMANFGSRSACRGQIVCTIPYIRTEVNIFIVFRALGVIADKDIIERCVYDFKDKHMIQMLKNTMDEAAPISTQDLALDYIAKRGPTIGIKKEERIKYAADLMTKDLLPHIGIKDFSENKKAYFLGYMTHRLCL